ncbi:50S ribosomal protein L25/general stress protein Ctc [Beggiatoa leptomitoformis]|uniref:Large ribosomal subunit protein bL25 n=1 Tax=Beggiatoa leptomitoformis TaxID=288004 RepID=A0A2N9YJQ2_9GAMM|nr:50S ribosomal protein L25/general stress protein Ctc [Beggiatoa leptomitoformis]ALG69502.1 50S ribosomal protein L25/general stress protein Ctc [Beggiatoa leptomitoformis]AUI70595.1 50S ribosomal protein L25/general stress protein Ctc [Beggiatoa leptomitoformis]
MSTVENFEIIAQSRADIGKGASRRLRRDNKVPAVLYGATQESISLTLSQKEISKHLEHESFYSHVLTIQIDGNKTEKAVLKDVQRHPYRPIIMHVDFQRINESEKIHMHVPLHFINEDKCIAVKTGGGIISHHQTDIEIYCFPKDLPEYIEVDLEHVGLNQIVHLSDLKCPAGIEIAGLTHGDEEHNTAVVSIHKPRGATDDEATAE